MAEPAQRAADTTANPPRPAGSRARRAAIAALFSVILLIPRLRRLRRRPVAWTAVRVACVAVGAGLAWRFARTLGGARPAPGTASLLFGVLLAAFGLLVRARPEGKSMDAVAGELGALVTLNGGSYAAAGARPVRRVSIAVGPERLVVLGPGQNRLAEIPLGALTQLAASATPPVKARKAGPAPWQLEVSWQSDGLQTARFVFEGYFAEHLARVAEQSIASQWKKELPVLKS